LREGGDYIINSKVDSFYLLKTKPIYEILDGDREYGEFRSRTGQEIKLRMPRLSGPDLCGICQSFGIPIEYHWGGGANLSRWQYVELLFDECIKKSRCSDLLSYLFAKSQFKEDLEGMTADEAESAYKRITKEIIDQINGLLSFGGHELCVVGNQYAIKNIGDQVKLSASSIKVPDRKYINDIAQRAFIDIEEGHFDSAITKTRTLLEEVFCYMIEQKNMIPSESGNINELFNQAKGLYKIHTDPNTDKRINDLINGINKIVTSVSSMRNKDSDAHGVGAKRIEIKDYHARLYVNAAVMLSEFFLSLSKDNERNS